MCDDSIDNNSCKMKESSLPSYLEVLGKSKDNPLTFKKSAVITLMEMVKEELGNTLNPKFIANHRK